ncbi:MAG: hypothetical protein WDO72_11885 [Pseudomonadota bacterium]
MARYRYVIRRTYNRFADVHLLDDSQPVSFGPGYQVHDGLLDIIHESDCVTVSWNQFVSHDKALLFGHSAEAAADRGRLRVALHHNLFENLRQSMPCLRYGRVHVYDNLYRISGDTDYQSSWGVGFESRIYADNDYFDLSARFCPMEVLDGRKGMGPTAIGNWWTEKAGDEPTEFVAVWNATFDVAVNAEAGWSPALHGAAPVELARRRILSEHAPAWANKKE